MKVALVSLLLLIVTLELSCAYRILFIMPFGSKSHKNGIDPIAEELGLRGHEVVMMSTIKVDKDPPGVKNIFLPLAREIFETYDLSFFVMSTGQQFNFIKLMIDFVWEVTNATYHETEVIKLIESTKITDGSPKYDVVIIDAGFNDFALPLAHHLGLPVIYASPATLFSPVAWNLNIPFPFTYIPSLMSNMTIPMTFLQRTTSTIMNILFTLVYRNHFLFNMLDKQIQTEFLPNSPNIMQLEKNVSFLLTNSHPSLNYPSPTMPYYKEVGCLHCKPAKPLPKDLEDFLQKSGDAGVIYFSLGSVTKGSHMPMEMRDKLINAFAKVDQQVLWKYEIDIENLPNNVKLTKWAPQQDLLGHSQVRLFITHGGGLSTMEAAYHGCPLLGFPLGADQAGNMANSRRHGFAEDLDWQTFTEDELLHKINMMLGDKRYRESALEMSAKLKDHVVPPRAEAAYWVEYVIRHKGAPHLKSGAEYQNIFQYFLIDVIAFIAFIVFVVLVIIYLLLRLIYKFLRWVLRKVEKALADRDSQQIKTKLKQK